MHQGWGYGPPLASRGSKHPTLCDHPSAPISVSAVPSGCRAQCLVCGTLGPVCNESEAARLGLLGERAECK
jgi:hypothetical protein